MKDNKMNKMEKLPFTHKDEREIWEYLALINRSFVKARTLELRKYKITIRHAATLEAIYQLGYNATPTKIAQAVFREPNSISEILHRMKRNGLVKKLKDYNNRKQVKYILTEKGIEAYYKSRKRSSYKKIMSGLNKDEQKELKSLLKIILYRIYEES